jgi:C-methyltransferase
MEQQPHEVIWSLSNAYIPSRFLHIVAELGVADDVGDRAVSARELASKHGVNTDALDRILRLLAAHGIFAVEGNGFRHTPASELLRSNHPMSMRAFPRMMGLPVFTKTFDNLEHTLQTGSPALETVEPQGLWAYFQDHPGEAQIFGESMTAKAAGDIAAILGAYDFSRFGTLADIGGGHGHLLRAVLDSAPNAHGVLFDLPDVIGSLEFEHDRLTTQSGDFFADALPRADAYMLMDVIHDWGDEQCIAILKAIRDAAPDDGTVLIIENVLPEDELDPRGQTLDSIMLTVTGGRERTPSQLNALLASAGFSQGAVIKTAGPLQIVEAQAA